MKRTDNFKKVLGGIALAIGFSAMVIVSGNFDYETECHPHECAAVSESEIQVKKSGNIYSVNFDVETGKEYMILFEADNVTPKKIMKELD